MFRVGVWVAGVGEYAVAARGWSAARTAADRFVRKAHTSFRKTNKKGKLSKQAREGVRQGEGRKEGKGWYGTTAL